MRLPHESLSDLNDEKRAWELLEPWEVHPGNARLERHAVYTFNARYVEQYRVGNVFLAGDAAHLMPPFAGQGMCSGLRDVAMDQGLPRPLALYRDGMPLSDFSAAAVLRLNDQHAFVTLPEGGDIRVGDVVEFGISHPCTCLDRHTILYGLSPDHTVATAYLTSFG